MKIAYDLTGKRFGRLIAIRLKETLKHRTMWECLCDCGKTSVVRSTHLTGMKIRSCGCLNDETRVARSVKHRQCHTKLYYVWNTMRQRCENINSPKYFSYGGRGITLCAEWHKFIPFYEWATSHGYCEGLTIDRINNDGNYTPENCRWATYHTQRMNRRDMIAAEKHVPQILEYLNESERMTADGIRESRGEG